MIAGFMRWIKIYPHEKICRIAPANFYIQTGISAYNLLQKPVASDLSLKL
jgi:hypothetical protein